LQDILPRNGRCRAAIVSAADAMLARMSARPFLAVQTESTDPSWFEIERQIIEAAGGKVLVQRAENEEQRIELLRDAQAVLVGGAQINRTVIEAAPNLELIVRYGVGLDTLDIPAATEHGVLVAHYPDFCQPEVANHALMLLLAVARKLVPHDRSIRSGQYRGTPLGPSAPLHGETMGIVALGNIGRHFARRAEAIGMRVIAYDPYVDDDDFREHGVERAATLEDLIDHADHISIHAPLTSETHHMFSREQFARMKPATILVNTARGPIVDQEALVEALRGGQIGGAGLDVFEVEPLAGESLLCEFDNVVLTPHSAFYSEYSNRHIKERVGQTVVAVMEGRWPDDVATIPNRHTVKPRARLA
jgi:D-3-phosphoglycerate dehydrogenase / 2-oxoglutarate reductase